MAQQINLLWMAQRMIAGLLYLLAGCTFFMALLMTVQGTFTIFHSITFIVFVAGMVKIAQYPFQPIPKLV